jgi:hypothetical protein
MNVYRIAEADYIIAHNVADAWVALAEHTGESVWDVKDGEGRTDDDVEQLPPDREIAVSGVDGVGQPIRRTAAEWVAFEGRGFLCSSEW